MRDSEGSVVIEEVFILKIFFVNSHIKVFPEISKEFAFYYKLLYYTILETVVKLFIPLAILVYTNFSIYRLVKRKNPFVSKENVQNRCYARDISLSKGHNNFHQNL